MESVEVREMEYILAVNQEQSFSRAAEKSYISQPALSKIVKKVEKKLGAAIFDRGAFPLKTTPEGERFIEYFLRIQEIHKEIEQYCEELRRQKKCDLNIGAPSFFCTYVLPPIVTAFQMDYPGYNVKLIETNDDDLRKFLRTGALDMGLTVESNMPPDLASFVLKSENIILAVPRFFPVNQKISQYAVQYEDICSGHFTDTDIPCVPMKAFAKERFLFLKPGNDMYRRGLKICSEAGFEPQIVMELDQLLTAYYLAEAGQGITFTRASIPYYAGATDGLYFYKIDHPDRIRQIRVYHNGSDQISEQQKIFIEYMKNYPLPG